MDTNKNYTAFAGFRCIVRGNLETVLRGIWNYQSNDHQLLIFEDETGEQVDCDLHGSQEDVLARYLPPRPKKGPGRPRLGVVSREVSLLPRHWEWLERQPQKASGTLRRLVETARKNESGESLVRERLAAVDRFLWAIAGNLEGFEEVGRALYARKWSVLDKLIRQWPPDIRDHVKMMVEPVHVESTVSNPGDGGINGVGG